MRLVWFWSWPSDMGASYAIFDEQGTREKVLDNWQ